MELGTSDLTAPFTVDQACQGPLKQHKWGLVSLCQSMHNTPYRERYGGTKVPRDGGTCPQLSGPSSPRGPAAQLAALASSRFKIREG